MRLATRTARTRLARLPASLEKDVREIHELYRRLVDSSPDGVVVCDGDRLLFVNATAIRLFGAPDADALLKASLLDLFSLESRALVQQQLEQCCPDRPFDVRILRFDDTTQEVEMLGARLDDPDRDAIQIVLRDVSGRKRVENTLRENEERLTLAFAGALEGVWDWNLETNAVVYSRRWKEMLGYDDDE